MLVRQLPSLQRGCGVFGFASFVSELVAADVECIRRTYYSGKRLSRELQRSSSGFRLP